VPAIALVVATYAAMLGLAWLIHRVVEQPVAPVLLASLTEGARGDLDIAERR
jgi:peptidoglycan/LPS O-acetylase OafA/YrhL